MTSKSWVIMLTVSLALTSCNVSVSGTQGKLRRVGRLRVGAAYDVYVEGGYAYVTNNDGVVIVDV